MGLVCILRQLKLQASLGLLLCLSATYAQTEKLETKTKVEVIERVSSIISEQAFVPGIDFTKWPDFVKDEKADIDAATTDDEFQRAVNTALRKFGASHVLLMTPRTAQSRRTRSAVGIGVSTIPVPEGLSVIRIVKDGPADKAGIAQGDTVIEVDGKPATTYRGIAGDEGTTVVIKVKHMDGKLDEYKITRRKYSTVRPPELIWLDKDTAQFKLYSFESGYDRNEIVDLMSQADSAKNLVIDLRDNGGGLVRNLQHLLGMLIPETKPLGTFIRKTTVNAFINKTGGKPSDLTAIAQWSPAKFRAFHRPESPFYTGRVAVLVNRLSGSASEIAAAALHDLIGAPIIGTKSAGAVLASTIVPASNGFLLQFPFEDYVTIKGVRLEGSGVSPDIDAPDLFPRPHEAKDGAVDKAIAYFAQTKVGARN